MQPAASGGTDDRQPAEPASYGKGNMPPTDSSTAAATDNLLPNGISADTGRPLPSLDALASLPERVAAQDQATPAVRDKARPARLTAGLEMFGVTEGIDPEKLSEAGWGVVFASGVDAAPLKEALAPLLKRRQEQAGALYAIFEDGRGVRPGEDVLDWLARQGTNGGGPGLQPVNPANGVPYYLLLVASPSQVPMEFQYMLDLYWAVGRLHFDGVEELARYSASVVAYETAKKPPQRRKQATVFATAHPFDAATQMFTAAVARPFAEGLGGQKPVADGLYFAMDAVLGASATKACLAEILRGNREGGVPALLFSGTHGMVFHEDDARLAACQGALVCQDWQGYGSIDDTCWFAGADVPADARLQGMIHFMFACYSGGWSKLDSFRDGPDGTAKQVAPEPGIARLPQALLAHPNGSALAVIAHIDRAWAFSFRTVNNSTQNTGIRDVVHRLLLGKRVGSATDAFNMQWAALAVPLADALRDPSEDPAVARRLARLWIARDDVRNYAILGDPAVRRRVEDMVAGS